MTKVEEKKIRKVIIWKKITQIIFFKLFLICLTGALILQKLQL
jgi:hypothetical protein